MLNDVHTSPYWSVYATEKITGPLETTFGEGVGVGQWRDFAIARLAVERGIRPQHVVSVSRALDIAPRSRQWHEYNNTGVVRTKTLDVKFFASEQLLKCVRPCLICWRGHWTGTAGTSR